MSLASLQPPLLNFPPLQPRPATTGSMDLMLPLQPKLLPGFNVHSAARESKSEPRNTVFEESIRNKLEHLNEINSDAQNQDNETYSQNGDAISPLRQTFGDQALVVDSNYLPNILIVGRVGALGCASEINVTNNRVDEYSECIETDRSERNRSESKLSHISEENTTDSSQRDRDVSEPSLATADQHHRVRLSVSLADESLREVYISSNCSAKNDMNENFSSNRIDDVNSNVFSELGKCDKKTPDGDSVRKNRIRDAAPAPNDDREISINGSSSKLCNQMINSRNN